jgi:transposase-like protein
VQRTIKQAAQDWGVSPSLVRKWVAQERVSTVRPGHEILITSKDPPQRAQRLTADQRAAWPKGPRRDTDRAPAPRGVKRRTRK